MSRTLTNIGLHGGYADGVDDWGPEMDDNLLKLSLLVQAGVLGRVAAVPGSPAAGDAYVLTDDPHGQTIAVYDNAAWVYFTPIEGWWVYDLDTQNYISFDGAAWGDFAGGGSGVPAGGTTGQVLTKLSDDDGDADWADSTGGGGDGPLRAGRRVLASARIDCTDTATPVISNGVNVASVTKTGTGLYTVEFTDALTDLSVAGFNGGGQWALDSSNHNGMAITIDMAATKGLKTTEINLVAHAVSDTVDGDMFDADGWFSFEVFDVTVDGSGVPAGDDALYRFGSFFTTAPGASEVLMIHAATDDFTLPVNFASTVVNVGSPPAADFEMSVQLNNVEIGTITIDNAGVVTMVLATATAVVTDDIISLVAPVTPDGDIADIAFTFRAGTALSGGGGGKNGVAPAIIQQVHGRNKNGDVALVLPDGAPTVGNLLLLIWTGSGGNSGSPPAGFSIFGYVMNESAPLGQYKPGLGSAFQGCFAAWHRVVTGDGDTYTGTHGSDLNNWSLFEIEDCDLTYFQPGIVQMINTEDFLILRQRPLWDGLNFVYVETDSAADATFTSAGVTTINTFTAGGSGWNHNGTIATIDDDTLVGDVLGTYNAANPSTPLAVFISLAKRN